LLVDNSKTLDEEAAQKRFEMLVKKGVGKFIKKPVQNFRGKNWIKKQKIMKEAYAVRGNKVEKFITGVNVKHKGKRYKEIEYELIKIDNRQEAVLLRILSPKKLFGQKVAVRFQTLRRGPFLKTDTSKTETFSFDGTIPSPSRKLVKKMKKKGNTSVPYGSGYEKIKEQKEIKKVVGVYGGRFQPFGPHHKKTYEWLKSRVDDAYITTSNIKQPPRHPMNFKEKVRHMIKMGIPKNRIVQEKSPYVAKNVLKNYDKDTTAVVYIFGAKDG
jgi:hypothetical protein